MSPCAPKRMALIKFGQDRRLLPWGFTALPTEMEHSWRNVGTKTICKVAAVKWDILHMSCTSQHGHLLFGQSLKKSVVKTDIFLLCSLQLFAIRMSTPAAFTVITCLHCSQGSCFPQNCSVFSLNLVFVAKRGSVSPAIFCKRLKSKI